jgi:DNA-binding protein H-NS
MARRSYESIQAEIARLQGLAKKLERRSAAAKQRARRKVFALMKKLGLTLIDLSNGPKPAVAKPAKPAKRAKPAKAAKPAKVRKRRTRKVAIKYRGPKRGQTWTGRGRTPRWMAALIAEGKKKEDFLLGT